MWYTTYISLTFKINVCFQFNPRSVVIVCLLVWFVAAESQSRPDSCELHHHTRHPAERPWGEKHKQLHLCVFLYCKLTNCWSPAEFPTKVPHQRTFRRHQLRGQPAADRRAGGGELGRARQEYRAAAGASGDVWWARSSRADWASPFVSS